MSASAAASAGSFSSVVGIAGRGAARNGVGDGGAAGGATCAGARRQPPASPSAAVSGWPSAGRCDQRGVHAALGVGAGIGRFEIDDVAKEDLSFVQFVAPDDDGLEGQRAFAEACDHRLAAGLDALGDRDFAFAGQQLDRAHLAQIHPHGIVGAFAGLGLLDLGDGLLRDLDELVVGIVVGLFLVFLAVGIVGLGDVDAHVREHRHDVLDLLRRGGVGRQDFVELIEGHEAALLGLLDHLLDGGIGQVEQRRRRVGGILLRRVRCLVVFFLVLNLQRLCLGGHSLLPKRAHAIGGVAAACTIRITVVCSTRKGRRKLSPPPASCRTVPAPIKRAAC